MSGLAGWVHLRGAPLEAHHFQEFSQQVTASSHSSQPLFRDDYRSGEGDVAVARLHLGILNPQPQPVTSPDGRTVLFLDGEVYNEDLDPERQAPALLNAYLREGDALFPRLNGHFLLAIIEPQQRRLRLVTDRTASLQVFYTRRGDLFAFSPRIEALLSLFPTIPKVNALAVANFLSSGCILENKSLVQGLELMGPATVLTVEPAGVHAQPYWQFAYRPQRDLRSPEILQEELSGLLLQAVKRQSRDAISCAVTLSGGWDSRAILWCLRQLYPDRPLHTITWGADEFRAESDIIIAQRTAQHFQTLHAFYPLLPQALPSHFRAFVGASESRVDTPGNYPESLRIFERIRDELKVDLLFRGNEPFGARRKVTRDKQGLFTGFIPDLSCFPFSYKYMRREVYQKLFDINIEQSLRLLSNSPYPDATDRKDHLFLTQRWPAYQSALTQLKRQVVEERSPFLDNDLLDFVSRLPAPHRYWKSLYVQTVRRMMPEIERLGLSQTNSLINWENRLRTDSALQEFLRNTLLEKPNGFSRIFEPRKLRVFLLSAFRPRKQNRRALLQRVKRKLRTSLDVYELELDLEIFRLAMLKVWTDDFLKGQFDLD